MMEFTYDGMVRWGFGFYNPNHAAALFAALLPFLWAAWERFPRPVCRIPIAVATLLTFTALALTFSRTGAVVAVLELILYFGCRKCSAATLGRGAVLLVLLLFAFLVAGVVARFTLDRAVTNRLAIWQAGATLFAANPLGVGYGNSGLIVSAFLLPPRIVCRTLVNSHLTLLVEYGIFAGVLWFGFLFYALLNGFRYRAAHISLIGLAISAFSSSIFDGGILFDFREAGGLSRLNQSLSWGILLLYLGLIVFLSLGHFHWKRAAIAASAALLLPVSLFLFSSLQKIRLKLSKGNSSVCLALPLRWRFMTKTSLCVNVPHFCRMAGSCRFIRLSFVPIRRFPIALTSCSSANAPTLLPVTRMLRLL